MLPKIITDDVIVEWNQLQAWWTQIKLCELTELWLML